MLRSDFRQFLTTYYNFPGYEIPPGILYVGKMYRRSLTCGWDNLADVRGVCVIQSFVLPLVNTTYLPGTLASLHVTVKLSLYS